MGCTCSTSLVLPTGVPTPPPLLLLHSLAGDAPPQLLALLLLLPLQPVIVHTPTLLSTTPPLLPLPPATGVTDLRDGVGDLMLVVVVLP